MKAIERDGGARGEQEKGTIQLGEITEPFLSVQDTAILFQLKLLTVFNSIHAATRLCGCVRSNDDCRQETLDCDPNGNTVGHNCYQGVKLTQCGTM